MVDKVRKLNTWLMKSGYVKAEDIVKHKKTPTHLIRKKKKGRASTHEKV